MLTVDVIISVIAVAGWLLSGAVSKRVTVGLGNRVVPFLVVIGGIIPMLIAVSIVGFHTNGSLPALITSAIAGVFLAIGFIAIYRSLRTEKLTPVAAMGELQALVLVMLGILALGEMLTHVEIIGVIMIFAGAFFLITTEQLKINKGLIPAVVANVSWTVYWIIMTYSVQGLGNFAVSILISRIVAIVVVSAYLLLATKGFWSELKSAVRRPIKGSDLAILLIMLALIGAFGDGGGDAVFSYLIGINLVAVASAISALNPMFLGVIGYFLYGDRMTKVQTIGFATMIIGAVILAVA